MITLLKKFFTKGNIKIAALNLCNGLSYGLIMGYTVVFLFLSLNSHQCENFKTQEACLDDKKSRCHWDSHLNICSVSEFHCMVFTKFYCKRVHHLGCFYDSNTKRCLHRITLIGNSKLILLIINCIGGALGSLIMWPAIPRLGIKFCLMSASVLFVLSMIIQTMASSIDNIGLSLFALFLSGIPCGIICVVIPIYNHNMLVSAHINYILIVLQMGIETGMFITSIFAISFRTTNFTTRSHLSSRMLAMNCICIFLLCFASILNFIIREDVKYPCKVKQIKTLMNRLKLGKEDENVQIDLNEQIIDDNDYNWQEIVKPICCGIALSLAQQVNGYTPITNAKSNKGVKVMTSVDLFDLQDYAAAFVLQICQFIMTFTVPLLILLVPLRLLYLLSYGITVFCCFMMMVLSAKSHEIIKGPRCTIEIFLTLLFVTAYSIGMKPLYLIFSVNILPTNSRPKYTSLLRSLFFIFSLMDISLFEKVHRDLRESTGHRHTARAVHFLLFVLIGIICFTVFVFMLYPFYSTSTGIAVLREIKGKKKQLGSVHGIELEEEVNNNVEPMKNDGADNEIKRVSIEK